MQPPRTNLLDAATPFTVATAISEGISREQLRDPSLRRLLRGVRVRRDVIDSLGLRCDAALAIYPAAVLSHDTAAALYGLPEPLLNREVEERQRRHRTAGVHLTVAPTNPKPKRAGVCGHVRAIETADVGTLDGRPLTSPVRTFVDLAEYWSFPDLLALGDAILRGELAGQDEFARAINAAGSRRGIVNARRAATNLDARSCSAMESLVRARLLAAGLPKPEVNVVLHHDDGRYLATPDLLYRAAGVAIEYEGGHHLQRGQFEHDVARDRSYAEAGIRVVRVSARDVLVLHRELTDHIAALLGL